MGAHELQVWCAIFFEQPTATEKQMEKELSSQHRALITPEEYLRLERPALNKSEYLNGEMVEMPGVRREHTLIVTNFVFSLGTALFDRPFEV